MAVVAEFISVLRKIRDVIYPEVNALYEDSLVLKESIDVGKAEFDADFAQFNTDYDTFIIQKNQVDIDVNSAQASASSASASATIATNKSNEIKEITAQSTTGAPGTSASASYNPTDGKFTFVIPQGSKGDKGDSFTVNSSGITASRALYDNQPTGWSFLNVTTSLLYFKQSNTTADWSSGVPFGKGDKGDTGDTGVGIASFTYISTNHTSGLSAQSGGTDTYRVTLTNDLTFDYQIYNGLDADLNYVDNKIGIVQGNIDTLSTQIANHINLSGVTAYHLLGGNLSATINANYIEASNTTTRNYTTLDYIFDSLNNKLYDCILASTSGVLLTNTTYFTLITAGVLQINNAIIPLANGVDSNGSKNNIIIANETITGLTYTQGKNYVYAKNDGTYGVKIIAPSYGKDNQLTGDFYNIITNKWYSNTNIEITESRNYLNHIVHADQNGQVTYVEELPKIEYKDIVKANEYQGKNACTAWANIDMTTTPPTIKDGVGITSVIRTATGVCDIYFKEIMDNLNYTCEVGQTISGISDATLTTQGQSSKQLNKVIIYTKYGANGINSGNMDIHIFGGKN